MKKECGGQNMQQNDREIILDALAIQERVGQLGQAISRDYVDGNLLVIGVLKGAFIFMADLIRVIDVPLVVDFIQVSSYGSGASSSGQIVLRSSPAMAVSGRDVLLVEDIIDSGLTLQWLVHHFMELGARSVKVCVFIDKAERRAHPVPIDYCGFSIPKGFLVGYGLDFNERYRSLPTVCHLKNPV